MTSPAGVVDAVTSTYLAYLGATVGLPLVALAASAWARGGLRRWLDALGVLGLIAIAFSYTYVWDGTLIERGVWWYGEGVVTGRVWHVPLGELGFFLLQTAFTGLWVLLFDPSIDPDRPAAVRARPVGLLVVAALELLGLSLYYTTAGHYLGAILVWGVPIIGFLWFLGGPVIWRARRLVAAGILAPTCYLWLVDRIAIGFGLWTISPTYTTGGAVAGLPIEEMVFFLVTNTLIVFGLTLYLWVIARAESSTATASLLALFPRGGVGRSERSHRE